MKASLMDCGVMKFKEGNKIEVLRTNKLYSSWFPGEIVSTDGDKYTVRYQLLLNSEGEPVIEEVPQGDARPQPPASKEEEKWALGDVAEVFDLHCWRIGNIVKILKNNCFVIRLSGSIQLKEFHESSLRVQQAWQNRQWIVIRKACGDKKINRKRNYILHDQPKSSLHLGGGSLQQHTWKEILPRKKKGMGPHVKVMKRNPRCDFQSYVNDAVGELGGGIRRTNINVERHERFQSYVNDAVGELGSGIRRTNINVERHERLPSTTLKQVDAISSGKANIGKRHIIRSSEMDVQMQRLDDYPLDPFPMTEVSDECSVASCSANNLPYCAVRNLWKSLRDASHGCFDDAESFCPSISERKHISPCHTDELDGDVHKLELHAYKTTMQALYASGPLSWEQESLLTNLRLSLHISTEEHLLQLKQLLSVQIL